MDELGGPTTFNHYPVGWAHAMDTPFQWTKQVASHFGGTRNGMVISWPARIKDKGGIRTQFHHVIDIAPTILEAVGVQMPDDAQRRPAKADRRREHGLHLRRREAAPRHRTQYFEMIGNRAIYHDGWVAATTPPGPAVGRRGQPVVHRRLPVGALRHDPDFSEANNLAAKEPKKLRELQDLFWVEAAKYNVLPLDNSKVERLD